MSINCSGFVTIPQVFLAEQFGKQVATAYNAECQEIGRWYEIYRHGAAAAAEGTNGDYTAADLRYKLAGSLVKKEARFLFSQNPDIVAELDAEEVTEGKKQNIALLNKILTAVYEQNGFAAALLRGAVDCFVGKRIAITANFSEQAGVSITFLPSTNFLYETEQYDGRTLKKFACFMRRRDTDAAGGQKFNFFCKVFEKVNDAVYFEELFCDAAGNVIEQINARQKTLLSEIPAVVIVNAGLTSEVGGVSEIEDLRPFEEWFTKLANADIDAERKSMNPIKYVVDMSQNCTKGLSTAAGAFWDLGSDQNLEKASPQVGMIEPAMNYSQTLKTTLERIQTAGYNAIDMPNTALENLQGVITSGKALKAIYWPLVVRCREKMQSWAPALRDLSKIIIEGSTKYSFCVERYLGQGVFVYNGDYKISVVENLPLPEDEAEEKALDLSEVQAEVMSRKSYMKKWRLLSDEEADREIEQIAKERAIIENASFEMS